MKEWFCASNYQLPLIQQRAIFILCTNPSPHNGNSGNWLLPMGSLELIAIQLHLVISDHFWASHNWSNSGILAELCIHARLYWPGFQHKHSFPFIFHINENVQYSWIQGTSLRRSMEWRVSIWVVTKNDYSHVFCSFTWSLLDSSHLFFSLDHYNCLCVIQECKNLISQCVTSVSPHPQGWVILLWEKINLAWFLLEKKISVTFFFLPLLWCLQGPSFQEMKAWFSGLYFLSLLVCTLFKIIIVI